MKNKLFNENLTFGFQRGKAILIFSLIYSLIIANFTILGGFSLGFFLTVLLGQALVFIVFPLPKKNHNRFWGIIFSLSIVALSLTFFIYSDIILSVVNFFVILILIFIQILIYSESAKSNWATLPFVKSLIVSPFARFFISLPHIGESFKSIKKSNDFSQKKRNDFRNILFGIIIAIPLLIIVTLLLSSADLIFKSYTQSLSEIFNSIKTSDIVLTIIFGLILFPFIFSFVHSHYSKWSEPFLNKEETFNKIRGFSLNPVIFSTTLLLMNLLYGFFSWIQFQSLFGAFTRRLPEDVTYAEYAREGFFQLAAVSFINIVLIILTVSLVKRSGQSKCYVRGMSVLLMGFTFVLLTSAAYRMYMYIDVYALTKLRVLVSLFMVLIAFVLIFALIKEFFVGFNFLKYSFLAALIVLIGTNYLNINKLIANYNIDKEYTSGINSDEFYVIDSNYLIYELSYDAIPPLVNFVKSNNSEISIRIEKELIILYENNLENYPNNDFRTLHLSKLRAKEAIEKITKSFKLY